MYSYSLSHLIKKTDSYFTDPETRVLLEDDLETLASSEEKSFTFYPETSKYDVWYGYIEGLKGTVYEGGVWKLKIVLPPNYPIDQPSVKFLEPIPYHPHVSASGDICNSYLRNWHSSKETNGSIYSNNLANIVVCHIAVLFDEKSFVFGDGYRNDIGDEFRYNRRAFMTKIQEQIKNSSCQKNVSEPVELEKINLNEYYCNAKKKRAPRLANIGNTCYGNSIIQILFHTNSFKNKILRNRAEKQTEFYCVLRELFQNMSQTDRKKFDNNRNLLINLFGIIEAETGSLRVGNPDDSFCFFLNVLKLLRNPTDQSVKKEPYSKIFYGLYEKKWICSGSCGKESTSYQDTLPALMVEPELYEDPQNATNLFEYSEDDEDECCGKKMRIEARLIKAPKILVIQLKTRDKPKKLIHDEITLQTQDGEVMKYEFYGGTIDLCWGFDGVHASAIIRNKKQATRKYVILSDESEARFVEEVTNYPKILFYEKKNSKEALVPSQKNIFALQKPIPFSESLISRYIQEMKQAQFLKISRFTFLPLCSVIVSLVSSESLKFSGKYIPLNQFLYLFDSNLPINKKELPVPCSDLFIHKKTLFGLDNIHKLSNKRILIVGAGVIGSEYLRVFCSYGLGTGDNGEIIITDFSTIAWSNLKRQFVYRRVDIGKNKAQVACNRITQKAIAMFLKVEKMVNLSFSPDRGVF